MFHTQVHALRRSFNVLKARVPKPQTVTSVLDSLTSMHVSDLLHTSCRLWVDTPERRMEGYTILDQALPVVRYPRKGKGTTLAEALHRSGWPVFAKGKPPHAFRSLIDHAFPCRFRDPPTRPGIWQCTGVCPANWHRSPAVAYVSLAIDALMHPDEREAIAAKVVDPPRHRRR
jgi:hypothetical protein